MLFFCTFCGFVNCFIVLINRFFIFAMNIYIQNFNTCIALFEAFLGEFTMIIGIDLGTTHSVVTTVINGKITPIKIYGNKVTVPSIVDYSDQGDCKVGLEAMDNFQNGSNNTIFSIKRSIDSKRKFCQKTPIEISSDILKFLKHSAEKVLQSKITEAVITVPAHFNETQRMATKKAASLADIKVLRLLNEPTAAALAYGIDKDISGIFAVYDFGGGTFDFSILKLVDGIFQVLVNAGDNFLGGDDIDYDIVKYNLDLLDISGDDLTRKEFAMCINIAKNLKENVENEYFADIKINEKIYQFRLNREILNSILDRYIERSFKIIKDAMLDVNIENYQLNGIILVGGMTKSPYIRENVANFFQCELISNINPDEVVAIGAGIQAQIIKESNKNALLIDVNPLSLGIETIGGGVDCIIPRNTPIPAKYVQEYTTYVDNQSSISFNILQGERQIAKNCKSIAKFELNNIPLMPAGGVKILVSFSIDVNGLLEVEAVEKNTNIKQSIIISPAENLTYDFILKELSENFNRTDSEDAEYLKVKLDAERSIKNWSQLIEFVSTNTQAFLKNKIDELNKCFYEECNGDDEKEEDCVEKKVGEGEREKNGSCEVKEDVNCEDKEDKRVNRSMNFYKRNEDNCSNEDSQGNKIEACDNGKMDKDKANKNIESANLNCKIQKCINKKIYTIKSILKEVEAELTEELNSIAAQKIIGKRVNL